jgi:iron-sulfur cluster assembly protein
MSVETFVPSTKLITLSDSAIKHFESKLKDKPGQLIRLSTRVSADSAKDGDEIVEISPTLRVAVSEDAAELVRSTEIDYVTEGVNGIIKYNNPNVVDECGCGESFNVG